MHLLLFRDFRHSTVPISFQLATDFNSWLTHFTTFKLRQHLSLTHLNSGNFYIQYIQTQVIFSYDTFILWNIQSRTIISSPTLLSTPQRSTPGRAPNFLLRTNLQYANRKYEYHCFYTIYLFSPFHIYIMHKWHMQHYAFQLNTCYHCCPSWLIQNALWFLAACFFL